MFERNIYQTYGLFCEERFLLGDYEAFTANDNIYIFVPKDDYPFPDRLNMAKWLKENGEERIAEIVPTLANKEIAVIDGFAGSLFLAPKLRYVYEQPIGEQLAIFHQRGELWNEAESRKYRINYFNQWNVIWEKRLDQLERWYIRLLQQGAQTEIDEQFLLTFPYYLGLTETAIQYFINSKSDHPLSRQEKPTICHGHFTEKTWLILPYQFSQTILPTDFLLDHPSRDIAEYIRYQVLIKKAPFTEVAKFIDSYTAIRPITDYSWQLIFARLLFPVHYFTAVETFYNNQLIERYEKLAHRFYETIHTEQENEQLLKVMQQFIPNEKVVWLNT